MLSRRVLRIKVMQALYEFIQSGNDRMDKAEKALVQNTEKIYDLYIYQLSALVEIIEAAQRTIESGRQKFLPSDSEVEALTKFIDNRIIRLIEDNTDYRRLFEYLKINWSEQKELFKKIYNQIRETEDYQQYMYSGKSSFEEDKRFIINIFRDYLADCEELQQIYEEMNIHWVDDYDIVSYMIVKTLNSFAAWMDSHTPLPELFLKPGESKDEELEDKTFMIDLFRKTIIHSGEFEKMISEKAENWELERIALMDLILIRMALSELSYFPSIPVKVTLNEYIEISKIYSSAKSRIFINGILDKLIIDMKTHKKIIKMGRGLME